MKFRPGIVLPHLAFATLDCNNEIYGESLIPHLPPASKKMDDIMKQQWNYLWPWKWRWSDMQILYLYVRNNMDAVKTGKDLGTTKYVISDRIKRLNLTHERIKEIKL